MVSHGMTCLGFLFVFVLFALVWYALELNKYNADIIDIVTANIFSIKF